LLLLLFLLLRRKMTPRMTRPMTATPPTTPPTIAPTGVDDFSAGGGGGVGVGEEDADSFGDGVLVEVSSPGPNESGADGSLEDDVVSASVLVPVSPSTKTVVMNSPPSWPSYVVSISWAVE